MRNWDSSDEAGLETCPADADEESAREVAAAIGIPLHVASFERQYWTEVFEPFIARYELGLTPNPDVDCNRSVKFGHLLEYCLEQRGASGIATGHYCTVAQPGTSQHAAVCASVPLDLQLSAAAYPLLVRGVDPVKDQSYFLCGVPASALQHIQTPLGNLTKAQVRQLAQQAHLPNAGRRDSYGICFVGKRKLPHWLPQYMPLKPGHFVCVDTGAILGATDGVQLWTEGQGAKLGGMTHKYTVVGKTLSQGQVLVAPPAHPACHSTGLVIPWEYFNLQAPPAWLAAPLLAGGEVQVQLRIRHRQDELVPATARLSDAACIEDSYPRAWLDALAPAARVAPATACSGAMQHLVISFQQPQPFVSPGQTAALYHPDVPVCLGGGPIVARQVTHEAARSLRTDMYTSDGVLQADC